jgi:hypothetical protein
MELHLLLLPAWQIVRSEDLSGYYENEEVEDFNLFEILFPLLFPDK